MLAGKETVYVPTGSYTFNGNVIINGALIVPLSYTPDISVGGNWIDAEQGFVSGMSIVKFIGSGNQTISRTKFYQLAVDSTVVVRTSGTVDVINTLFIDGTINQAGDTICISNNDPNAIMGQGIISNGSIKRAIMSHTTLPYRFESNSTFVQFADRGTYPDTITLTNYTGIAPLMFQSNWKIIGGHVDTLTHTITLDSVSEFSLWAFGTNSLSPNDANINRIYRLAQTGGHDYSATVTLRYDLSEIPNGISQSSLAVWQWTPSAAPTIMSGWNMLSLPLEVGDPAITFVFLKAKSKAFSYKNGYQSCDSVLNGYGYWLKFDSTQRLFINGTLIASETVSVRNRWNMVGSISSPLPVSSITSIPGGMVTSQFFGYNGSYSVADTIQPGRGYWVKVNQNGWLIMSSSGSITSLSHVRIIPDAELPPSPPNIGSFGNQKKELTEYLLQQSYPNPFNPTALIHYQLQEESHVHLSVYNLLGQEIRILVDESEQPGYRTVQFDASNLPSGIYFYRITAGAFTDVKKMVLIR
ncbi:MAG: T9SS type A sorting domain-containing protein [Bacteroidota bacterium]